MSENITDEKVHVKQLPENITDEKVHVKQLPEIITDEKVSVKYLPEIITDEKVPMKLMPVSTMLPINEKTSYKINTSGIQKWAFAINKVTAINPKDLPQSLQFVVDNESNVVFLLDTGSEISILPKELTNGINRYFLPQSRVVQGIGNGIIHPI